MVYTSESRALAALETLVHVERPRNLRNAYLIVPASIPDELVESLDASSLPPAWRSPTDMQGTRAIGDTWSRHRVSVALRVPSVLLPQEFNVLLSPEHPDWRHVTIGEPEAFAFDSRFVR